MYRATEQGLTEKKQGAGVPLNESRSGTWNEVVSMTGGRGLQQRLADMGIGPGARIRIESSGRPGPFVVGVKGARFVLGQGMVDRIRVKPAPIPKEEQII